MSAFSHRLEEEARRNLPRTLARTIWLHHHLAEFLHSASAAALPVIVLKGAALAETVYPRLGLRDFRDIDILVCPEDAATARLLLEELCYAADAFHWQELVQGRDGQVNFTKQTPCGPVIVEMHVDLLNNDLFTGRVCCDLPGLWARSRLTVLASAPARVLGPEDQLLHLCLHLAGHHWHAPRSLRDIAYVCACETIDWPHLGALAAQARMGRIAWLGLRLAEELFDARVPANTLAALAPPQAKCLAYAAFQRIQDAGGKRTALLRLPLFLLLCEPPARWSRLPGEIFARRHRRRHDRWLATTARPCRQSR